MFAVEINGAIVAEDVMAREFVCNLSRCKGACCVQGDAGAPLESDETSILESEFENIKPFLRPEGITTIAMQGTWIRDPRDGEPVTPLVDGKECAYATFKEDGTAMCGIEIAWKAGATTFQKPISCHLYPVRITKYKSFDAVNYHRWEICSPACELGTQLKVPVYVFLKDALIRKYGQDWYNQLSEAAQQFDNERK